MNAMKFWIGNDDKLSEQVQAILFELGYGWNKTQKNLQFTTECCLFAKDGYITYCNNDRKFFEKDRCEEINIDWMRSKQTITIEIEGQKTEISLESAKALKKVLEGI